MDLGSYLEKAWNSVEGSLQQAANTALPGVLSGLSQNGIDILTEFKKENDEKLKTEIKNQMNSPSSPLGSAISSSYVNAFLSLYGGYLLLGIAAIALMAIFLRGK